MIRANDSLVVVVVLLLIIVNYSTALKWIPLKPGDAIPGNAISIIDRSQVFVGRARHYDEVLPAEVNTTFAIIESCGRNIIKRQYEILVSRDNCRWQIFPQFENVPENIVRGGTAANGEPIYIGRVTRSGVQAPYNNRLESIYLTSKTKNKWSIGSAYMLVCDENNNWVDTSSKSIPNNTVYGGLSEDENYIYVARLKSGCSIIPGQVIPEEGLASAVYKNKVISSAYCQVLVGGEDEYKWVTAYDGEIPDYAVVSSKDNSGELMYVALVNDTVGYIMPSIAVKSNGTYNVLVRNVV